MLHGLLSGGGDGGYRSSTGGPYTILLIYHNLHMPIMDSMIYPLPCSRVAVTAFSDEVSNQVFIHSHSMIRAEYTIKHAGKGSQGSVSNQTYLVVLNFRPKFGVNSVI